MLQIASTVYMILEGNETDQILTLVQGPNPDPPTRRISRIPGMLNRPFPMWPWLTPAAVFVPDLSQGKSYVA